MNKKLTLLILCLLTLNVSFTQNLIFSGGHYHSAMLCDNGVVYTFGQGTEGQLGHGALTNSNTPVQVLGLGGTGVLENIQQVDAGSGDFTIALSECGDSVYTWGNNSEGQLGNGTSTTSNVPVRVIGIGGTGFLTDIRFISGGNGEAYVINNNDEVIAWGGNDLGQQGRGTVTAFESTPDYVYTGPGVRLDNVKFVDGGDDFGVALKYDGTVWFWGKDARGVGGQGVDVADPGITRSYAVQVMDPTGTGFLQNITKITAGDRHIMALSSGDTLYSWGANWGRQVGNDNGNVNQTLPTAVLNVNNSGGVLSGVRAFAAGNAHSVALLNDGTVVSWGLRRDGHLGDNDIGCCGAGGDGSPYPIYTMNPTNTAPLSGIANVSDGDNWSFAIDSSNNVYIWGRNDEGQLGFGDNTDRLLPVEMTSLPCSIPLPDEPPLASLGPDIDLCDPLSVVLDANDGGSGYTYAWYMDGVLLPSETGKTITVDTTGEYKVTITKTSSSCSGPVLETSSDSVVVTTSAALPVDGTYCPGGTANLGVIGSGEYKWFDAAVGGNVVGTGDNITTPVITGPGTVTFYAEDTSAFSSRVGPSPMPSSGGNVRPWDGGSSTTQNQLRFTAIDGFILDSVTVGAYNGWDGNFAIEVTVVDAGTGLPVTSAWSPVMNGSTNVTEHQIYLGLVIPAAGDYYLRYTNSTNGDDRILESSYGAYSSADYPFTNPFGIVTITEHYRDGSFDDDRYSLFWDWVISTGSLCDRVPVDATEDCPACTNPTPTLSLTAGTNPFCEGDNFTLTANPNGATGTITYNWYQDGGLISSGASTTLTITGATLADAGNYTVSITSTDCATESNQSAAIAITVNAKPSDPTITVNPNQTTFCEGEAYDLTAASTVSSGTITYTWSGDGSGTTNPQTGNTAANSYTYTVSASANGCTSDNTTDQAITVNAIPTVVANSDDGDNTICNGDMITLTGSGATTYSWTGGVTDGVAFAPGATATYTVTGTTSGCDNTDDITITVNDAPNITNSPLTETVCAGTASAGVTLTADVVGTTYAWTSSATAGITGNTASGSSDLPSETFTKSTSGSGTVTYTVTPTANGCVGPTADYVITVNPLPSGTGTITPTADVCEGTTDTYTVSGYSDVTTYDWTEDNGATDLGSTTTTEDITAGSADFTITVTPSNACGAGSPVNQSITVNGNTGAAGSITGTTNICDNQTGEGFSIAAVANATSYTWTITGDGTIATGQGTNSITADFGTDASYTIEVTPTGLCGDGTPEQIIVNNTGSVAVAISLVQNPDPICAGSDADIVATVTGGGATPTIEWYVGGALQATNSNTTYTLTTPAGGEIVDAILTGSSLGCATGIPANSNTVTVQVEAQPTADITTPAGASQTINSTSTTLTAAAIGGTETGLWSKTNGGEQGNLVAPLNTTTVTLENLNTFESGSGDGTTNVCWTVSSATGTCPDAFDCVDIIRLDITAPDVFGQSDTVCQGTGLPLLTGNPAPNTGNGETAFWTAIGSSTGTPSGNDFQPTNTTPGVYVYRYTIENVGLGISESDSVVIQIDETPTTADAGGDENICATIHNLSANSPVVGIGSWSATGGISFDDTSDNTAEVSGLSSGSNILTWTVTNGVCPASTDNVDINVTGSVTTPDAGIYSTQCESTTSLSLAANSPAGGEIGTWTVNSGPGTIADVNNPTANLTITGPGTIDLNWTISNGVCTPDPTSNTTIIVQEMPTTSVAGLDSSVCQDNILLYANTPTVGTGQWLSVAGPLPGTGVIIDNTDPNSQLVDITGTFTLRWMITNGTACPPSMSDVNITSIGTVVPNVSIAASDNTICLGDAVTFTASPTNGGGSPTYEWFVGGTSQGAASTSNTYNTSSLINSDDVHVVMTSSEACADPSTATSSDITMSVLNPVDPILTTPNPICVGEVTQIDVSVDPSASLTWFLDGVAQSNGSNTQVINSLSHDGVWEVTADNGVCPIVTSDPVTAVVNASPVVSAGSDLDMELGQSVTINGSSSITPVFWTSDVSTSTFTGETTANPTYTALEGGVHSVTITADNGTCSSSSSILITVTEPIVIPNAFTPNGDGENDEWIIKGLESYPDATLEVFNRWGSPVYKSVGTVKWWDGTRNGKIMPTHTYYYLLTINETETYTGSVTLVR